MPRILIPEVVSQEVMVLNVSDMRLYQINAKFQSPTRSATVYLNLHPDLVADAIGIQACRIGSIRLFLFSG